MLSKKWKKSKLVKIGTGSVSVLIAFLIIIQFNFFSFPASALDNGVNAMSNFGEKIGNSFSLSAGKDDKKAKEEGLFKIAASKIDRIGEKECQGNSVYMYREVDGSDQWSLLTDCGEQDMVCSEGKCVSKENLELLGTEQANNYNTNFNKGGVKATTILAQGVYDKWQYEYADINLNWDGRQSPYNLSNYIQDSGLPKENTHLAGRYPPNGTYAHRPYTSQDEQHRVWAGHGTGPAISKCDVVNGGDNYAETFNMHGVNTSYSYCGHSFTFPAEDYGENCHRDHWGYMGGVNVGAFYKDLLYNKPGNFNNPISNASNPKSGMNALIDCQAISDLHVDQTFVPDGKSYRLASGNNIPPVPPNECSDDNCGCGSSFWDWYTQWPHCTYWYPDFDRSRSCDDYWSECLPIGAGTSSCSGTLSCDAGTVDATSLGSCFSHYEEYDNECACEEAPSTAISVPSSDRTNLDGLSSQVLKERGSCSYSGQIDTTLTDNGDCDRCTDAGDASTCNQSPYTKSDCTKYECSFVDNCTCTDAGSPCQWGYEYCTSGHCDDYGTCVKRSTSTEGCETGGWKYSDPDTLGIDMTKKCVDLKSGTSSDPGVCIEYECSDRDCDTKSTNWTYYIVPCKSTTTIPDPYEFKEAEDCCREWHWGCDASCLPDRQNCFEGNAVRYRPDYKYALIEIGDIPDPDPDGTCGIDHTGNITIELFHERAPKPRDMEVFIKDAEDDAYDPHFVYKEVEIDVERRNCSRTSLAEIKNLLLGAGRFVMGTDPADPTKTLDMSGNNQKYFDFESYLNQFIDKDKYIYNIRFAK